MAKDALGNEIEIGDRVIFIHRHYKDYRQGVVVSLAPKTAQVKIDVNHDILYRQAHYQLISLSALIRAGLTPETLHIERGEHNGNGFTW